MRSGAAEVTARKAASAILLGGFAVMLALTAPGQLTYDSVQQLASGRSGSGLVQAITEISDAIARAQNPAAALRPAHARDPAIPFGTVPAPAAPNGAAPNASARPAGVK
jgi:hypothetical protein